MPNIKNLSGKEIIKILESFGFEELRQKGSHIMLIKKTESGKIGCVVPNHKEVKFGTIKGILKQANITVKDFLEKIN